MFFFCRFPSPARRLYQFLGPLDGHDLRNPSSSILSHTQKKSDPSKKKTVERRGLRGAAGDGGATGLRLRPMSGGGGEGGRAQVRDPEKEAQKGDSTFSSGPLSSPPQKKNEIRKKTCPHPRPHPPQKNKRRRKDKTSQLVPGSIAAGGVSVEMPATPVQRFAEWWVLGSSFGGPPNVGFSLPVPQERVQPPNIERVFLRNAWHPPCNDGHREVVRLPRPSFQRPEGRGAALGPWRPRFHLPRRAGACAQLRGAGGRARRPSRAGSVRASVRRVFVSIRRGRRNALKLGARRKPQGPLRAPFFVIWFEDRASAKICLLAC